MKIDPSVVSCVVAEEQREAFSEIRRRVLRDEQSRARGRLTLRQLLLRDPIKLGAVEARILRFLARRPYHPFTRRKIAAAVSSERFPVTEEMVDRYIRSLRDQLGFYHDYVQSVRYVGYQFRE